MKIHSTISTISHLVQALLDAVLNLWYEPYPVAEFLIQAGPFSLATVATVQW